MNHSENQFSPSFSREQIEQASLWLSRRERGLSESEKNAFEHWLSEDPSNETCFFEHEVAWASFDVMDEWRPAYSRPPNPDLFETRAERKRNWFIGLGGLAAAVLFGFFLLQFVRPSADHNSLVAAKTYTSQNNEKHFLEDGSSFYLLPGSELSVAFTDTERTIDFAHGEAEFTVAHDSERPFVVNSEVGSVTALGTVFSVRQKSNSWEVLVTEGRVKVDEIGNGNTAGLNINKFSAELVAGQKIFEALSDEEFSPTIDAITPHELEERLAWKDQIIDMVSAPLEEILSEFSHFDEREVTVLDEELKRMRMTVAIKPDNLEDFIDLLELSAGVKAIEASTGSIVLTRSTN